MAKIVDQYGHPIDKGTLAAPQTAEVSVLHNTWLAPFLSGLTPASLSDLLMRADMGYLLAQHRVFSDMEERDPHLAAEMMKRKQAILNLDWQIVPPADATAAEKAAAEWADQAIRNSVESFEDLILAMMDAVGHGFAPIELEWQLDDGELLPIYHPRPQEWFRLTTDRRELRLTDGSADGAVLRPFGWIQHAPGRAKTGYLGRMGLHRVLSWPFLYKAYAISDFAEFLETFGLPIIVGKYGQGASAEQKESLMQAVTDLGHDARAIMPADMLLEIQKITANGGGDTPHLAMVKWADDAQSKAILGQTLSADAKNTGMGSGVAKLHDAVRLDIRRGDARQVAATLTRDLVYPMIVLNRGGLASMKRCPRLVFDANDLQDIAVYANALPNLSGLIDIPQSWVRERLGIPAPKDNEPVLKTPPAGTKTEKVPLIAGMSAHGAGCSCCGGQAIAALSGDTAAVTTVPDQAALDAALDALPSAALQAQMQALLQPILAAAARGADQAEMLGLMAEAWPQMDQSALVESLSRILFAADLFGRLTAKDD